MSTHPHLLNEDFSFRNNLSLYLRSHFFRSDARPPGFAMSWTRNCAASPRPVWRRSTSQPIITSIPYPCCAASSTIWRQDHRVGWVRAHDFRANVSPHNFFLRRQRQMENGAFTMPDYMTAVQANMKLSVADFCARIARLSGTIEIVVHPAPRHDPDFPADWHYGITPRRAETQFLIQAVDRLRDMGIGFPPPETPPP